MNPVTIGLLHPGAMGSTLGKCAVETGHRVLWLGAGRSEQTRKRAKAAGLQEADSLDELCAEAEHIFSVCPPDAAIELARSVAQKGFAGIYTRYCRKACCLASPSANRRAKHRHLKWPMPLIPKATAHCLWPHAHWRVARVSRTHCWRSGISRNHNCETNAQAREAWQLKRAGDSPVKCWKLQRQWKAPACPVAFTTQPPTYTSAANHLSRVNNYPISTA